MSVTSPKGWSAAAVRAGTKRSGDPDLALVLADRPASVAGAFTTNKALCAHIHVCRPRVLTGAARGVLVSAGIANASTGRAGIEDAARMAAFAAEAAGVPQDEMLVCSTGSIGGRIPVDAVEPAIRDVATKISPAGGDEAARAIMTTDTRPKTSSRRISIDGVDVTVGGMAKGAGMIEPAMAVAHATMLAFLTTDASASPAFLREVLGAGLPTTFNAVTVDGARSTNDTVLLFANGAAGTAADGNQAFADAVREVMADLARQIAADGEGATKLVRVRVSGARSDDDAHAAARQVANSFILRSSIWGNNPNWGRVVQAIGQVDAIAFDPSLLRLAFQGVEVARDGVSTDRKQEAAALMDAPEVVIEADLGLGSGAFEILTCDVSPDYVHINVT